MTRRELFLTPLAALVLRMAQRSLPAAGPAVPLSKYDLFFDVGVDEFTTISVYKGQVLVGSVHLPAGRHRVNVPIKEALKGYMLKCDRDVHFEAFFYDDQEAPRYPWPPNESALSYAVAGNRDLVFF